MTKPVANRFAAQGWARVPGFLEQGLCGLVYAHTLRQSELGRWAATGDHGTSGVTAESTLGGRHCYGDPFLETLLEWLRPQVEQLVGKSLWPTYSFCQLYREGMALTPHKDRPACEYSLSLCLGRDYSNQAAGFEWPLYMGGTPVETPPGTALLYKGMELEHWREPLKGRSQMQLFLHYVDQQGEWAECCKFDGRPWLGAPAGVKLPHLQERLMRKMRGG